MKKGKGKKPKKEVKLDEHGREILQSPYCDACKYYKGRLIKTNGSHKGGPKNVEHWECKLHSGCVNTMYSLCCIDFEKA